MPTNGMLTSYLYRSTPLTKIKISSRYLPIAIYFSLVNAAFFLELK